MYEEQRRQVARCMRRLYRQGLTTTSGGNISLRLDDGRVVLTPSKIDKGALTGDQVGVLALDGTNLTPDLAPSIESSMHLRIYRRLPRVQAVVHAHPPIASAFCASGAAINCHLIAESYAILGEPVLAPYALMGTVELAEVVATAATRGACVLMQNHGVLTTGQTLVEAFDRIEVLEAAAKMTLIMRLLGDARELAGAQLAELDRLLGREDRSRG